jgi:hypothetical protein
MQLISYAWHTYNLIMISHIKKLQNLGLKILFYISIFLWIDSRRRQRDYFLQLHLPDRLVLPATRAYSSLTAHCVTVISSITILLYTKRTQEHWILLFEIAIRTID